MRYEVFRIAQFLFSLALIAGAFISGLSLGWYCWGRSKSAAPIATGGSEAAVSEQDWVAHGEDGRGHLFRPDGQAAAAALYDAPPVHPVQIGSVDLRFGVKPRVELPAIHLEDLHSIEAQKPEGQDSLVGEAL
ncbi:MAG: hypothetical protein WD029_08565 [Microthrixaceae bacterium]